ncbi:MAG: chromosome segregation protein SMC [Alphaproteobacteria bacterium]
MKISRLRLTGFKSFVEPTDLLIEPGLTGVVGPNGCGKSNLLEALRWVMGDSSPKSMRSAGMEDVIFSGSGARPARNSAEVLIGLDNQDRDAPSQFNDSEELEVVRRIERDAGSIYRVNGREVRQRDVQLLFADASTGAHSPALVKQGQISELINMKPKSRRAILEEAAGISGLHSRRHEAELRLKAAETNLERLNDVVQEIEAQLASLRKQARQATRYRNISGDIRRTEALVLHLKWSAARSQLSAATARLEEVAAALAEETAEVARLTTERETKAADLPAKRENEARAAAGLQRLNHEMQTLGQEEARARARVQELEARQAQLRSDLEREELLLRDAEESRARLSSEEESLKAQIGGQEAKRGSAATLVAEISGRVNSAEREFEAQTSALNSREADRTRLSRVIEDLSKRIERMNAELERMSSERANVAPSSEEEAKLAESQRLFDEALQAQESSEAEAVAAEIARQEATNQERAAREALQAAERALGILEAEAEAIARLLQIDGSDLWPPMIDAIKVEPGFEVALGAALGDDLAAPADEAAPAHWRTLPPLADAPALPTGARPLSEIVNAPQALHRRLMQIGLVDSVAAGATLQGQLKAGQRLVTREGDLWRWDGYSANAEAPTPQAKRLEQRNRLGEVQAALPAASKRTNDARSALQIARGGAEAAQEAEMTARRRVREAQADVNKAREEAQGIERGIAQTASQLAGLEASERRVREDLDSSQRELAHARDELAVLGDDSDRRAELSVLKDDIQKDRIRLSEAQAALQAIEREASQAAERLKRVANEAVSWLKRTDGAKSQIEAIGERVGDAARELEGLADIPAQIEEKRRALLSAIADAEGRRSEAGDALAIAESELRTTERLLRGADERLSESRELRARLEAQAEAAAERSREVGSQIHDVLGCQPEQAFGETGYDEGEELPTLEATEAKLERYRRERENLGGVNLRADEEANEAQARLDTLVTEKTDLEGAIQKLRSGIASLNREGRERILAAFGTVNAHFERLFTTLFEGGSAKLELVESDDPLEAGLEIIARPPGKRPATLSLLSGGEQALTAMSLIFAVFLSNPAPICVLDEVDAPLDDANVDRFCNLLNEMARTTDTRFLVITHHPVTMSRMDRLYGVTMAERGVSQLVSVDLTAAAALRAAG